MLTEVKIYSPSGALMRHGYKNEKGKYCGEVREYYADKRYPGSIGKLKSIANYSNGKKYGLQRFYNRTGINVNGAIVYSEHYPASERTILNDKLIFKTYRDQYKKFDLSVYSKAESYSFVYDSYSHYFQKANYALRYTFNKNNKNEFYKIISEGRQMKSVYYTDTNKITMRISDSTLTYEKVFEEIDNKIQIRYQNVKVVHKDVNIVDIFGHNNLTDDDIIFLKLKFS